MTDEILGFKCRWCGKKHNGKINKSACSVNCQNKIKASRKKWRDNNKENLAKRCITCYKPITKGIYCSDECRDKFRKYGRECYYRNKERRRKARAEIRKKCYLNNREMFIMEAWAERYFKKKKACEECGSILNLEFHHLKYTKEPDSVVTLCRNCHNLKHMKRGIK